MASRGAESAPSENITAIRISVTNNETRVCRKIIVKGLYGNQRVVATFQNAFKRKISDAVPEHEQEAFAAMATQPDLTQDIEMTMR